MYKKQKYVLLKELKKTADIFDALIANHAIIAGGAVRAVFANEQISDYDIYFKLQEDLDRFLQYISHSTFNKKFETDCAMSYELSGVRVQVITMRDLICAAEDIVNQFDYTVCMGAYDFDTDKFVLYQDFLEHLALKELYYNTDAQYPLASLFRLKKYMKKGYTISGVEIIKLGLSINNLRMRDYTDLRKQLQGIDTMFLTALTEKLMSSEYAQREYDFEDFMEMIDEYSVEKMESIFE